MIDRFNKRSDALEAERERLWAEEQGGVTPERERAIARRLARIRRERRKLRRELHEHVAAAKRRVRKLRAIDYGADTLPDGTLVEADTGARIP